MFAIRFKLLSFLMISALFLVQSVDCKPKSKSKNKSKSSKVDSTFTKKQKNFVNLMHKKLDSINKELADEISYAKKHDLTKKADQQGLRKIILKKTADKRYSWGDCFRRAPKKIYPFTTLYDRVRSAKTRLKKSLSTKALKKVKLLNDDRIKKIKSDFEELLKCLDQIEDYIVLSDEYTKESQMLDVRIYRY